MLDIKNSEKDKAMKTDVNEAFQRLSKAIQIRTVSFQGTSQTDVKPFLDFHRLLEESYPKIHGLLERKVINNCSLCYRWPGNDPELESIALLAHIDVVPVYSADENDWSYEPFSGKIADGFVWGRGTLDMKGTLMAIMKAVETLIGQGFTPERTIYLAFGHDEELGGTQGAEKIARYLKTEGVSLQYTLDEGMVILDPNHNSTYNYSRREQGECPSNRGNSLCQFQNFTGRYHKKSC